MRGGLKPPAAAAPQFSDRSPKGGRTLPAVSGEGGGVRQRIADTGPGSGFRAAGWNFLAVECRARLSGRDPEDLRAGRFDG